MTEDDTFNKLRKAEWNTVYNIFIDEYDNGHNLTSYEDVFEFQSKLQRFGWTYREFLLKLGFDVSEYD